MSYTLGLEGQEVTVEAGDCFCIGGGSARTETHNVQNASYTLDIEEREDTLPLPDGHLHLVSLKAPFTRLRTRRDSSRQLLAGGELIGMVEDGTVRLQTLLAAQEVWYAEDEHIPAYVRSVNNGTTVSDGTQLNSSWKPLTVRLEQCVPPITEQRDTLATYTRDTLETTLEEFLQHNGDEVTRVNLPDFDQPSGKLYTGDGHIEIVTEHGSRTRTTYAEGAAEELLYGLIAANGNADRQRKKLDAYFQR